MRRMVVRRKPSGPQVGMWPIDGSTQPYVVMYVGSSTTQGLLDGSGGNYTRQHQNYVNNFSAKLTTWANNSYVPQKVVAQTNGTITRPTTPGIWFYNCGLGGTTSADYIGADRRGLMDSLQPNLMIHMIGANDYRGQGISPATFKANCQSVINDARTRVPGVKHVFIHSYAAMDITGNPTYRWEAYGARVAELAASNADVKSIDVQSLWEARGVGLNLTDPDNLVGNDNIHSTPDGARFLAESIVIAGNLDVKEGKTIWLFDPNTLTQYGNSAEITSAPAAATALDQAEGGAGQTAGQRPYMTTSGVNGQRVATFDGTADTLDTLFQKTYGLPVTVFMVVSLTGGSSSRPLFSRTGSDSPGYIYGWATSNTSPAPMGFVSNSPGVSSTFVMPLNDWQVIAVNFLASDDQVVYLHQSYAPSGTSASNTASEGDATFPGIRSLRLGSNTTRASFAAMQVAYGEIVAGVLDRSAVATKMDALATRFGLTLTPEPPPRVYLRDVGTQSYANTLQSGTKRDLSADGWIDRAASTGTYTVAYNDDGVGARLVPTGMGAGYRGFNCYYYNTAMSSAAHWGRVKVFNPPTPNATTDPNGVAGVGIVLRHAATGTSGTGGGLFCKITRSQGWRIYSGNSNVSATESTLIASGSLPSGVTGLVAGDEITVIATGNVVHFYLNNVKLNGSGTTTTYNNTQVRVGLIISNNNAGELYDFKCGVLGSDTPP